MSDRFIFWDLETTGRNDKFNQITQVGAVLTDHNFEVKDKLEIHSKLREGKWFEPGALITTGVDPRSLIQNNYPNYYEASAQYKRDNLVLTHRHRGIVRSWLPSSTACPRSSRISWSCQVNDCKAGRMQTFCFAKRAYLRSRRLRYSYPGLSTESVVRCAPSLARFFVG